jgi:FkbM family methyltransferase
MHYDFIEIGTSDFHTLIQKCPIESVGMSVEPLQCYLDMLPSKPNVIKVCCAVSQTSGHNNIFHIPPTTIKKYSLPEWLKGCNSVGLPHYQHSLVCSQVSEKTWCHPTNLHQQVSPTDTPLSLGLVKKSRVKVKTYGQLMEEHGVESVDVLKVDAEGMDSIILHAMMDYCENNPASFPASVEFEAYVDFPPPLGIEEGEYTRLMVRLRKCGYENPKIDNRRVQVSKPNH